MNPFRLKAVLDQITVDNRMAIAVYDSSRKQVGAFYREQTGSYVFSFTKATILFDRYTVDPATCVLKLFNGSIPVGKVYCKNIFTSIDEDTEE